MISTLGDSGWILDNIHQHLFSHEAALVDSGG